MCFDFRVCEGSNKNKGVTVSILLLFVVYTSVKESSTGFSSEAQPPSRPKPLHVDRPFVRTVDNLIVLSKSSC